MTRPADERIDIRQRVWNLGEIQNDSYIEVEEALADPRDTVFAKIHGDSERLQMCHSRLQLLSASRWIRLATKRVRALQRLQVDYRLGKLSLLLAHPPASES